VQNYNFYIQKAFTLVSHSFKNVSSSIKMGQLSKKLAMKRGKVDTHKIKSKPFET